MKWFSRSQQNMREKQLHAIYTMLEDSEDYISNEHQLKNATIYYSFIRTIVNINLLQRNILTPLIQQAKGSTLEELRTILPLEDTILTKDTHTIKEKILEGYVLIQIEKNGEQGLLINVKAHHDRNIESPQVEYNILGSNECFIESLDVNIYLVRKRIPLPNFKVKEMRIGKFTKTRTAIIYIDGLANKDIVNTVTQRVAAIEFDQFVDASLILQLVEDNSMSSFPQLLDTERPDLVISSLLNGKVAILVDGSPYAVLGPIALVDFFKAFDDYELSWYAASLVRITRLISIVFSVLSTPLYISILTFHYQLIPGNLLATLISSRIGIPFPPLAEVIFMELTLGILLEAGVRLPNKISQTIAIVGGIVIGTASVQANLTSNVLLILVSMAALAAFTTPNYRMNTTLRLLRLPLILFAAMWGMYGIACCIGLIIAHLFRLESLGRPYIHYLFPIKIQNLKDAYIRFPFSKQKFLPRLSRQHNAEQANKKRDIDE